MARRVALPMIGSAHPGRAGHKHLKAGSLSKRLAENPLLPAALPEQERAQGFPTFGAWADVYPLASGFGRNSKRSAHGGALLFNDAVKSDPTSRPTPHLIVIIALDHGHHPPSKRAGGSPATLPGGSLN